MQPNLNSYAIADLHQSETLTHSRFPQWRLSIKRGRQFQGTIRHWLCFGDEQKANQFDEFWRR